VRDSEKTSLDLINLMHEIMFSQDFQNEAEMLSHHLFVLSFTRPLVSPMMGLKFAVGEDNDKMNAIVGTIPGCLISVYGRSYK